MATATITSKGQITIPATIRKALDLQSGDRVDFMVEDTGWVSFLPLTRNVMSLKGSVPKPDTPVSLDDMKATIKARGGRR